MGDEELWEMREVEDIKQLLVEGQVVSKM